jgi:hypothetical protein
MVLKNQFSINNIMKTIRKTLESFVILLFALNSCSSADDPVTVLSAAKEIKSFKFLKQNNTNLSQDYDGIIDNQAQTITFLFPANTDISQLKPSFEISSEASLLLNNAALVNNTSLINGTLNPVVTIKAADGSTSNYNLKFNFLPPIATTSNLPKMCVLYQTAGLSTVPFDTIYYTYNAKNKLIKYKDKSITYEFDYINDTIVSQRRGYYTSSKQLFESYDYQRQGSNIFLNILSISPSNGIGGVTDFWYLNGQIQKYTVSYYGVVKEEHITTQDNFGRVITDNNWLVNAQNNTLIYTDSWTYYDTIYDPNPLIGLRMARNDYGYNVLQHKAYALKSYTHDNSANSPYGSTASNYNYTTTANNYIKKEVSGNNTILEYFY